MIPLPWGLIWKVGGGIAAAGLLWFGVSHVVGNIRADERQEVTAEFTDAEQKAEIADLKRTLADERKRAGITEKKNEELARDMAADRVGLDAYLDRLRRSIAAGRTEGSGASQDAAGSGELGEAGGVPLVDDLRICTENTRRLLNAQGWYAEQRAMKPAEMEIQR
jgi:hypothetical protein